MYEISPSNHFIFSLKKIKILLKKQRSLLTFLSTILTRDEGGFEYKKAIVDTILTVIKESPESKENGINKKIFY